MTAGRPAAPEENTPRVRRPRGDELLVDVIARVVTAQGLIGAGEVGEALMVLEDIEDDLEACRAELAS